MLAFRTVYRREHIADITLSNVNTEYTLPTQGGQIPSDRFLHSLLLTFEGRMTNPASGGPTDRLADAPFSIIDRITVEGYHRLRQTQEKFIDVRAVDLRNLNGIYRGLLPYSTHESGDLSVTASATNDVRFVIPVPFVPLGLPVSQQANWLLDAPNYDSLKLTVKYADTQSVFSGATTNPTLSAYGSATGDPSLRVDGIFAQAGPSAFRGFLPRRLWRWFSENTSDLTATSNAVRLFNLPRGYFIRGILVKTGVKATGVTAGNDAYNTLSDTILSEVKLFRGINKAIRHWPLYVTMADDTEFAYGIRPATGYKLIDFAPNKHDGEVLDTRGLIAGPTGDIDLYLQGDVAGSANQAALVMYEEWRG